MVTDSERREKLKQQMEEYDKHKGEAAEKWRAYQKIRTAWVAGIIVGVLNLIVTLISVGLIATGRAGILGLNLWSLVDVFIIFGLTFGIYKKNRACAVIMFVYFANRILELVVTGKLPNLIAVIMFIYFVAKRILELVVGPVKLPNLIIAIFFGYFFFQGIRGTFAYHKIARAK
jgi:serine/threonine-protein kinase